LLQGNVQQIICLGDWNNTLDYVNCTAMRKWKWLSVNGCKFMSSISTIMKFLNFCQH